MSEALHHIAFRSRPLASSRPSWGLHRHTGATAAGCHCCRVLLRQGFERIAGVAAANYHRLACKLLSIGNTTQAATPAHEHRRTTHRSLPPAESHQFQGQPIRHRHDFARLENHRPRSTALRLILCFANSSATENGDRRRAVRLGEYVDRWRRWTHCGPWGLECEPLPSAAPVANSQPNEAQPNQGEHARLRHCGRLRGPSAGPPCPHVQG